MECVLSALLGVLWIFVAFAKGLDLLSPQMSTAETWADQFSLITIIVVVLAEIYLGCLLAFRPTRSAHLGALGLLGLFAIAFVLWPLQPQQSCGCAGSAGSAIGLDAVTPGIRLAVLASLHLLAIALLLPSRFATHPRTAQAA